MKFLVAAVLVAFTAVSATIIPNHICLFPCVELFAPVCAFDKEKGCLKEFSTFCSLNTEQCLNPGRKSLS